MRLRSTQVRILPGAHEVSYGKIFRMTRRQLSNLVVLGVLIFSMAPSLALAAGLPGQIVPCGSANQAACTVCDLAKVANNILNTAIYIAVFLSAVLFAWAGFKYLTNVANPGEVSRAKEIFSNVAIGLVIILASWLVIDILMRTLVGASVLPWSTLC